MIDKIFRFHASTKEKRKQILKFTPEDNFRIVIIITDMKEISYIIELAFVNVFKISMIVSFVSFTYTSQF